MGTGFSLFLIAVGAILAWAVNYTVTGVDIHVVGAILIFVGCVGLAFSLLFWESFSPFVERAPFRRRPVAFTEPDHVIVRQPTTTIVREPMTTIVREPRTVVHEPRTVVVREEPSEDRIEPR